MSDYANGRKEDGGEVGSRMKRIAEAMRLICRGRNVMQREVGGSDRHKVEILDKKSKGEEVAILFDPREKKEKVPREREGYK